MVTRRLTVREANRLAAELDARLEVSARTATAVAETLALGGCSDCEDDDPPDTPRALPLSVYRLIADWLVPAKALRFASWPTIDRARAPWTFSRIMNWWHDQPRPCVVVPAHRGRAIRDCGCVACWQGSRYEPDYGTDTCKYGTCHHVEHWTSPRSIP